MTVRIDTLKVGDKVAVWGTSMFPNRGYTVTKADKMKVVLSRGEAPGSIHERVFSVKRNCELATKTRTYVERYAAIITEAEAEEMAQRHLAQQNRDAAFRKVRDAAENKNIKALREAMVELEALLAAA